MSTISSVREIFQFMLIVPVLLVAACSSGGYDSNEVPDPPNGSVVVPNVTGLDQAAAESAITAAGLAIGTVSFQSDSSIPDGAVVSQNPAANTTLPSGSSVDLVVSTGPATIAVPDVVGLSETQAVSDIEDAGLAVGTVSRQNSDTVPVDDVISQDPPASTMVSPGSSVDLVVSLGPNASGFSDEFATDTLADWSLRHIVEGTPAQFTTLDINQSTPGSLTIIPTETPGWFADDDGPLVFKMLSGDFAVHTRVIADSLSDPGQAPNSNFNSAGLMARNADGATGPENYIMLNIGRQNMTIATGTGSETKTTVDSNSTLFLDPGTHSGELILCRIGDDFHSFRFLDGDSQWTPTDTFTRPDLPAALQVGMAVSAFNDPADLRAEFEFIRLLPTPATVSACTP